MPKKNNEKEYVFKQEGHLKKSYLGGDGEKQVTFEFPQNSAIEVAKLELLSRNGHRPALLDITIKVSPNNGKESFQKVSGKPKQKTSIGGRRTTDT